MSEELLKTPLNDWHRANGGKLVPFAGWDMPIQYERGPIAEHRLVRRSAGLFDITHMGRFTARGDRAAELLDYLITSDIGGLSQYGSGYGLLCREDGGILDDLFTYRMPDHYLIVVNAANRKKDFDWISRQAREKDVKIKDISDRMGMLALQGPNAIPLMDALTGGETSGIERFYCKPLELLGVSLLVGRTGYTGEDGVELYVPSEALRTVWEGLLEAGQKHDVEIGPVGLAARDSLRFEPAFPLYGHELTEEVTPVEARLKWACATDKDFIGKPVIERQIREGTRRRLVTLRLIDKGVPRQGFTVLNEQEEPIGEIVSGMYAPTVDAYCANAYVEAEYRKSGTVLLVQIRNRTKRAEVVKRPLYKPAYRS